MRLAKMLGGVCVGIWLAAACDVWGIPLWAQAVGVVGAAILYATWRMEHDD